MVRLVSGVLLALGLALTATAQGPTPPWITVTPKTEANPNPPPPAGQKFVYAEGQYALAQGQTIEKVVAEWWKEGGTSEQPTLTYVGQTDDQKAANGTYKTGSIGLDVKDAQGNVLKYTVIAKLYVKGTPPNPPQLVASGSSTGYQP
jgi:hypothetical protein